MKKGGGGGRRSAGRETRSVRLNHFLATAPWQIARGGAEERGASIFLHLKSVMKVRRSSVVPFRPGYATL